MFGLFKKTSWKIEGKALAFFRKVFHPLPAEFHFLSEGLERGLYKRFSVNHALKGNFYSIGFDPNQSDQSMTKGKQFELENIILTQDGHAYPLNITIYDGLWIGFEIQKNILDFNNFQVDVSAFKKVKSKFSAGTEIEKLTSGLVCQQLELNNLSEFEIDTKLYYHIKELGDGNYLAIDKQGKVYALMHDPYQIKLLNNSIRQFVDDVNNGRVDLTTIE